MNQATNLPQHERELIHLLLLDDARRGLADMAAGRTVEADVALAKVQQRRKAAARPTSAADPAKPAKRAPQKRG